MLKIIIYTLLIFLILQPHVTTQTTNNYQSQTLLLASPDIARYRQAIYLQNSQLVDEHNRKQDKTYELQLNKFSDLNENEINSYLLTLVPSVEPAIKLARTISGLEALQVNTQQGLFIISDVPQSLDNQFEPPAPPPTPSVLQKQVLGELSRFLQSRNLPPSQIERELYKRKLEPNSYDTQPPRPLNLRPPTRLLIQNDNFDDVDWTCMSGEVRNQGVCGSCYAIATVDSLSAFLSIYAYSFYVPLSIQEILDCAKNSMTLGCKGGFMEGSFAYMKIFGLIPQFKYPYSKLSWQNNTEGICKSFSETQSRFSIDNFVSIPRGQCFEVQKRLRDHPLSIGIAARRLLFYKSGIFNGCSESDKEDHAVLLVGYMKDKGWKIKNSWGREWGEDGYAWIASGNNCHVCDMAFYIQAAQDNRVKLSKSPIRRCKMPQI